MDRKVFPRGEIHDSQQYELVKNFSDILAPHQKQSREKAAGLCASLIIEIISLLPEDIQIIDQAAWYRIKPAGTSKDSKIAAVGLTRKNPLRTYLSKWIVPTVV